MVKKLLIIAIMILLVVSAVNASMLEFYKIDAQVNGKDRSDVDKNGGSLENLRPGDVLDIEVRLKNAYTSGDDIDINDVEITAILESIDDGSDIEKEDSTSRIKPRDKKTFDFQFQIPYEVEESTFTLTIEARGDDDNTSEEHTVEETIDIEIEKLVHELIFRKIDYSNTEICTGSILVDVDIMNIGENDEEDIELTLKNSNLNLNEKETFTLDYDPFDGDNRVRKYFTINIPENTENGYYPVLIEAKYGSYSLSNSTILTIKCEEQEISEDKTTEEIETKEDDQNTQQNIQNNQQTQEVQSNLPPTKLVNKPASSDVVSIGNDYGFIAMIVIIQLLLVALVVFVIIKLKK